jgi:toxin ParE1/3/4
MAQPPVDVHPEAIAEAQAAYGWYRQRNETAAEAFLAELDRAVELISEGPMRWPTHLHGTRRFLLRRFPFGVVYRQIGEAVQVVAVAHARRKPDYWKHR